MKQPQMIIVKYVDDYIYADKNKYNVQVAGISERKPMQLQTWLIACDTSAEAEKMREDVKGSGILIKA